jgi:hypothetical protein
MDGYPMPVADLFFYLFWTENRGAKPPGNTQLY